MLPAVGATVGMSLALRGGGVIWSKEKDEFPYITGACHSFPVSCFQPILHAACIVRNRLAIGFRAGCVRSLGSFAVNLCCNSKD